MIVESILILVFALMLDFSVGDPSNRYHPTAWIGKLIAKLISFTKNNSNIDEKIGGVCLVIMITTIVTCSLVVLDIGINLLSIDYLVTLASFIVGAILLKTTIAIRGMEKHALAVVDSLENQNIDVARENLAMIVKRNTKELDKNHILSGVLESISENTVDGITGPLFYYGLFSLPGAFVYRSINTIDSMIGYKNSIFINFGWFGAKCDSTLNYIPSRLTALMIVLATLIMRNDWRSSYRIMLRDGHKTDSLNAGYPMAALAGALGTRLEKTDHYSLGDGSLNITKEHISESIITMKLTSILFCGLITIPIIFSLSYLGWWIYA